MLNGGKKEEVRKVMDNMKKDNVKKEMVKGEIEYD